MAAIFMNGAELFEQIVVITLLKEGLERNLVKICLAVSEKKTFKDYTILCMYVAQEQGQIPWEQNFDCN